MPKITRHGGASNMYEIESNYLDPSVPIAYIGTDLSDESLGGPEVKEEESSVGNNSSLSSKPMPTIEELLGKDVL